MGRLRSSDLYVGQKPVVRTCTLRSVSSLTWLGFGFGFGFGFG